MQSVLCELKDTFKKLEEVTQLIDSDINNINKELTEDILEVTTNSEEATILSAYKKPFFAFLRKS